MKYWYKNRSIEYFLVVCIALITTIFLQSFFSPIEKDINKANPQLSDFSAVVEMDTGYITNFADDKILMGASHNVFVGEVINQLGVKNLGIGPETQFAVKIISNIKGNLQGVVTVDQQGGNVSGTLYVVSEDEISGMGSTPNKYLLQPGSVYLLATRYNSTQNWYTLNSFPTASKMIIVSSSLTDAQLANIAQNDSRVEQLQAAYPHEILFGPDVVNHNTRNSYISLHPVIRETSSTSLQNFSSSSVH
jgi:hypothetical protein